MASKAEIIQPGLPTPKYPNGGYFTVKGSVKIKASKQRILEALVDFRSYPKWNTFVTEVTDVKHPNGTKEAAVGTTMTFVCNMFPLLPKAVTLEEITQLDWDEGIVTWKALETEAERVHTIKELEDGICEYCSYETFAACAKGTAIRYIISTLKVL